MPRAEGRKTCVYQNEAVGGNTVGLGDGNFNQRASAGGGLGGLVAPDRGTLFQTRGFMASFSMGITEGLVN